MELNSHIENTYMKNSINKDILFNNSNPYEMRWTTKQNSKINSLEIKQA